MPRISPIGSSASDAVGRRAATNSQYRREAERLALGESIARQVIHLRLETGLTQAQLGKRMGTTNTVISRIESGRSSVSLSTLNKLAQACGRELLISFSPPRDAS